MSQSVTKPSKRSPARRWARGLLVMLLILILLVLGLYLSRVQWSGPVVGWWLQRTLQAESVTIEVRRLDLDAVELESLLIERAPGLGITRLAVSGIDLTMLEGDVWYRPLPDTLHVRQLDFVGTVADSDPKADSGEPVNVQAWLMQPERLAGLMPLRSVTVASFVTQVTLPDRQLAMRGHLEVQKVDDQSLHAMVEGDFDQLELRWLLAAGPGQLGSVMQRDGGALLTLNHAVNQDGQVSGHLRADLPAVQEVLLAMPLLLPESLRSAVAQLQALPVSFQRADLSADWQWQLLPDVLDWIPQGDTQASLAVEGTVWGQGVVGDLQGQWQQDAQGRSEVLAQADAELMLDLEQWLPAAMPVSIEPDWQLALKASAQGDADRVWHSPSLQGRLWRVDHDIAMQASSPGWRSDAPLEATWAADWSLEWPELGVADIAVAAPRADGRLAWNPAEPKLIINETALSSQQVDIADVLTLQGVSATVAPFNWQPDAELSLALNTRVERLGSEQHGLDPAKWQDHRLDLQMTLAEENLGFSGGLRLVDGTLGLDFDGGVRDADNWQAELTLQRLNFLQGSDFLSELLPAGWWPELLDIERGNTGLEALIQSENGLISADGKLDGRQLSGVYDRLLFAGLVYDLAFTWRDQTLEISSQALQLEAINPGVEISAVRADVNLRLVLPELAGELAVKRFDAAIAGGRAAVEPFVWNLADEQHALVLDLTGLDLSALLAMQGDTDIAGTGVLDGKVPLRLSSNGVEVDAGKLSARPPGGTLQYRGGGSDAAASGGDQRTDLVFKALSDFRFHELESGVDYDQDGTLKLAVRLHGHNPAVQDGHPVHFNINLEQDLPALLASLHLVNQVNETIERRVRQMYQQ